MRRPTAKDSRADRLYSREPTRGRRVDPGYSVREVMPLAILFFAGTLLMAQTPATAPPDPKFTVRSDLVFLPTRVQTKKADTIYALTATQFVVEDNGARQKVSIDEDPESSGLSLVVLVQCSRSAEAEMRKLKGLSIMIE